MQSGDLYPAALEIQALSLSVFRASKKDLERRLDEHGAHVGGLQFHVLRLLQQSTCTLSELSRELSVRPATLVPVVDALEHHGFVTRGHDPHDRRRVPLSLTPAGAQVVDTVPLVDSGDLLCQALDAMGDGKCRDLISLLRELTDNLTTCEELRL